VEVLGPVGVTTVVDAFVAVSALDRIGLHHAIVPVEIPSW
jgi:hypothetical protein